MTERERLQEMRRYARAIASTWKRYGKDGDPRECDLLDRLITEMDDASHKRATRTRRDRGPNR